MSCILSVPLASTLCKLGKRSLVRITFCCFFILSSWWYPKPEIGQPLDKFTPSPSCGLPPTMASAHPGDLNPAMPCSSVNNVDALSGNRRIYRCISWNFAHDVDDCWPTWGLRITLMGGKMSESPFRNRVRNIYFYIVRCPSWILHHCALNSHIHSKWTTMIPSALRPAESSAHPTSPKETFQRLIVGFMCPNWSVLECGEPHLRMLQRKWK